jgi:amidase
MNDIALLDATAQAELVRTKQVKPIELLEGAIERIERLNPQINAVVTPMYDEARRVAESPLSGAFAGVPFLMKDLVASYAGVRQTQGSEFFRDFVSPFDTELTSRYKRAGLIVAGKTNLPEFGLLPTTEPRLFGATRNPWNLEHSVGGSSGGAAAAVAAGIVPMAHGGDGGGSIRIPASCCGLFGLKPSRARISLGPMIGDVTGGLVCEHAITRTVRDSALLLDATAGPAIGDPYYAPPQERPYVEDLKAPPRTLRIALTAQTVTGSPVHEDCIAAVKDAAGLCEDLGHDVEETAPPPLNTDMFAAAFRTVFMAGIPWGIDGLGRLTGRQATPDKFEPFTWAMYEEGRQTTAVDYLIALSTIQQMSRLVAGSFQSYDVWLTPTLGSPPPTLGFFDSSEDPAILFDKVSEFMPFTPLQNATGQPAMSVPLYWNDAGLPVGVHFVARFGDEGTLFRLAAQLEEARPWANKRPPVSAV